MDSSRLSNPFARESPFTGQLRTSNFKLQHYESAKNLENDRMKISKATYNRHNTNNPFENFQLHGKQFRKGLHSENKQYLKTQRNINLNYHPLTKYENKIKLQVLDNQYWKRQKQQEQRYKLQHYGVEALRYSNYSTVAPPSQHQTYYSKNNFQRSDNNNKKLMNFHDEYNEYRESSPKRPMPVFASAEKPVFQISSPKFKTAEKETYGKYLTLQSKYQSHKQQNTNKEQLKTQHQIKPNNSYGHNSKANQSFNSHSRNQYFHAQKQPMFQNSESDAFKKQPEMNRYQSIHGNTLNDSGPQNFMQVLNSNSKKGARNPYQSYLSEPDETFQGLRHAKWSDSQGQGTDEKLKKTDRIDEDDVNHIEYSLNKKNYSNRLPQRIQYSGQIFYRIQIK